MKEARHQLVLLGFVCQGLSWDDWFLPLVNTLLWVLCSLCPPGRFALRPAMEGAVLILGCVAGLVLGLALGRSVHFFIGHGLVCLQAAWLIRPLTRREKVISLLIALFHTGVACTFLFDLRFLAVLAAALVLVPRALLELETAAFPDLPAHRPAAGAGPISRRPFRISALAYLTMALVMVGFFLVFPRALLRTPVTAPRVASAEQGTILDSVLDPTRSGFAQSRQVLFHIEGQDLGYLRCFSLTEFDGVKWSPAARTPWKVIAYAPWNRLGEYAHRRVRVKNAALLGRVLPTDGHVVFLYGRFFGRPLVNAHGGIVTDSMWNTANNTYDYWIDPRPTPAALPRALLKEYLLHPPASARLQAWLDQVLEGVADPYVQARRLEAHLLNNFTYQLGAPELNRLNPLEDFLFNQKQGHCERFAAALASLLRLKNIPSRVVIGYVPTSRNSFSGGFNIRLRDAHAWTEAWFPERGWVRLDATPRASLPPEDWALGDLVADLDYAWSSYVVNFDSPAQAQLFIGSIQTLSEAPAWMRRHWQVLLGVVTLLLLLLLAQRNRRGRPAGAGGLEARQPAVEMAAHYYGRMLRVLGQQGLFREPHQTPLEFLRRLDPESAAVRAEVRLITGLFCAARYGRHALTPAQRAKIESALQRLKESSHRPGPHSVTACGDGRSPDSRAG